MRGAVCVAHALRNAAAFGDLETVAYGPVADGFVLVAPAGRPAGGHTGRTGRPYGVSAADPGTGGDEGIQGLAQLSGIRLGKVDRVTGAVQGELDRAVRLLSVQIVDESGDYLPCHNDSRGLRRTGVSVTLHPPYSQLFQRLC